MSQAGGVGIRRGGVVLGVGTPWGLFRHPWVTAKLVINVAMLAVSGPTWAGMEDDVVRVRTGASSFSL